MAPRLVAVAVQEAPVPLQAPDQVPEAFELKVTESPTAAVAGLAEQETEISAFALAGTAIIIIKMLKTRMVNKPPFKIIFFIILFFPHIILSRFIV